MYEFQHPPEAYQTTTSERLKVLIESASPPYTSSTTPSSKPAISGGQILAGLAAIAVVMAFPLYSLCEMIVEARHASVIETKDTKIQQLEMQLGHFHHLSTEL